MNVDKFVAYDQRVTLNTTYITLFTIRDCQNRCTYCIENINKYAHGVYLEPNTFERVMDFIDAQKRKYVHFTFYGGEPTLNPFLEIYIKRLKERYGNNVFIRLTTNLIQEVDYFKKLPSHVQVYASLHTESRDYFADEWLEKAVELKNSIWLEKVFLMCTRVNWNGIKELYYAYKDKLPLYIYPIDDFRGSATWNLAIQDIYRPKIHDPFEDYQKEYLDIIANGKKFKGAPTVENFNTFKGMMCNAGFEVDELGRVTHCGAKGGKGFLMDLNFDFPKKLPPFFLCQSKDCPCDVEPGRYSLKKYLRNFLEGKDK